MRMTSSALWSRVSVHLQLLKVHAGLHSEVLLKWCIFIELSCVCDGFSVTRHTLSLVAPPPAVTLAAKLRVTSSSAVFMFCFSRNRTEKKWTQKWHPSEVAPFFDSVSWCNAKVYFASSRHRWKCVCATVAVRCTQMTANRLNVGTHGKTWSQTWCNSWLLWHVCRSGPRCSALSAALVAILDDLEPLNF